MPDEPPTLGEILRRLDRVERRQDERLVSLNAYQSDRTHDREQVTDLKDSLTERIKDLEESMKWAWRAAVTGIILPLVLAITVFLLLGRGPQ